MGTYYDGLNAFHKLNEQRPLTASAQLVYLHLLHENNRRGNIGTVQISDRELGLRTSLSKQTITEAKRTLKNRGLIDFHTERDKSRRATTYTLIFFVTGQGAGQKVGQTLGQRVGQPSLVPYTVHAKDLRPKDFPINNSNTRTREVKEREELREISDTDAIIDEWQSSDCFAKLDFQLMSELDALIKKLGVSAIRTAMDKAKRSNKSSRGVSFSYFRAVLDNVKGEHKHARTTEPKQCDYNSLLGY